MRWLGAFLLSLWLACTAQAQVAFDAKSTVIASNWGSGGISLTGVLTVGSSATLLIVGVEVDNSSPGTFTAKWGTQTMTQIGSSLTVTGGNAPASLAIFGVVNPTSGSQTLTASASGVSTTVPSYTFAISFQGSATSSVTSATTGFANNNATSSTMSDTSSASVPTTGMIVGWGIDCGSGFTSSAAAFFTSGTQIGQNENENNNSNAAYATGTGSTMTGSAALNASDVWAMQVVGIIAPATSTCPPPSLALLGVGC